MSTTKRRKMPLTYVDLLASPVVEALHHVKKISHGCNDPSQNFHYRTFYLFSELSTMAAKRIVIVDGARIPFQLAQTAYKNEIAVDLAQRAMKGLLVKTAMDPAKVRVSSLNLPISGDFAESRIDPHILILCPFQIRYNQRADRLHLVRDCDSRLPYIQHCARGCDQQWGAQGRACAHGDHGLHQRQPGHHDRCRENPCGAGKGHY